MTTADLTFWNAIGDLKNNHEFSYGPFPGGDPRLFRPDPDECTDEEIANWYRACAAWDRGQGEDRGPSCLTMGDGSAWTGKGYGIGTTDYGVVDWSEVEEQE